MLIHMLLMLALQPATGGAEGSSHLGKLCDPQATVERAVALHEAYKAVAGSKWSSKGQEVVEALDEPMRRQVARACRGGVPKQAPIRVSDSPSPPCRSEIGHLDGRPIVCLLEPRRDDKPRPQATGKHVNEKCEVRIEPGYVEARFTGNQPLRYPEATFRHPAGEAFFISATDRAEWMTHPTRRLPRENADGNQIEATLVFSVGSDCTVSAATDDGPKSDAHVVVQLSDEESKRLEARVREVEARIVDYNASGREQVRERLKHADKRWSRLSKWGYPENIIETLANGWLREQRLDRKCPKVGQEYACDESLYPGRWRAVILHPTVGAQIYQGGEIDDAQPKQIRAMLALEAIGVNWYLKSFFWYFGAGAAVGVTTAGFQDLRVGGVLHVVPFIDVGLMASLQSEGLVVSIGTDVMRLLSSERRKRARSTLQGVADAAHRP